MRDVADVSLHTVMTVALWIGVAHVIVGVSILLEPQALLVSSFAGLKWITAVYSVGHYLGGALLIAVGSLAILGGSRRLGFSLANRFRLIAPQIVVLVFTVASVCMTVVAGHYPDGYKPVGGTWFILADQSIAGLVSLFHVVSVLLLPNRRRSGMRWPDDRL